jgi:PhzF family phenazine biosynthesis protein
VTAIPFSLVDAFTATPFGGNPAAVCFVEEWPATEWMQRVAGEMNAGATAFVRRTATELGLRWFSPTVELELCGHGTLAAAHVLWMNGQTPRMQPIVFQTKAGALTARARGEDVVIDFPALTDQPAAAPAGLFDALGVTGANYVGRNRLDYLVELEREQAVRDLRPDFARLAKIDTRGVIVTSRADGDGDFVSRFFAPSAGIPEDAATGSAHCCLAVFWNRRLGKTQFSARQLSARGATLFVELAGDRVYIGGRAVTVATGTLAPTQ